MRPLSNPVTHSSIQIEPNKPESKVHLCFKPFTHSWIKQGHGLGLDSWDRPVGGAN